jgi:hypothetical protein
MGFHATNFTVSVLLLMAATLFMMFVRMRKPVENSWPFLYWIAVTVATLTNQDLTFDFRIILVGLVAGLLLRFEFLNRSVTNLVMAVEVMVWIYVLYASWFIITSY